MAIEQGLRLGRATGAGERHPKPIRGAGTLGRVGRDREGAGKGVRGARELAAHKPHDAEMIPDAVDRAVESRAARQVIQRAIELPRGEIAMPAPAIQQPVGRRDLEPARERGDRLAVLPDARLRHAQGDDAIDVSRVGGEHALGAGDRAGVALRTVLDTGG